MEAAGVITGYRVALDRSRHGLDVLAIAEVTLDHHHPDTVAQVKAVVDACPEVLECHMISGHHDFNLKIVAADMGAYGALVRDHLLQVPGVNRINSMFIMETLKADSPYPLDHL